MRTYQLVFLNANGRAQAFDRLTAIDSAAAAGAAKATGYPHEIEIWDGDELVRRLNCRKVAAPQPPRPDLAD